MKVKITPDSTCDLSPELLLHGDISITPLSVCCSEKVGADGTSGNNCRCGDHLPLWAKYTGYSFFEKKRV